MPTIFRINGFRFFFYTNEHLPKHIHVEKGESTAKFNLFPAELVKSKRFNAHEINDIRKLVSENRELFNDKWDEYFNDK
jgi:hypothetical protein